MKLASIVVVLAACGSPKAPPPPVVTSTPPPPPPPVAVPDAAPPAAATDFKSIPVDVDPDGMAWDAANARLVIADARANRLATWSAKAGLGTLAQLPVPPANVKSGLGQPVAIGGAWYVPRFGDGTAGAIFRIAADGKVTELPGLDAKRQRVGLAAGDAGDLVETWFTETPPSGGVARVPLAGGKEVDLATGLKKPVGVVVVRGAVIVAEQKADRVLLDGKPLGGALAGPDLATALTAGSIAISTRAGGVVEVATAGGKQIQLVADVGKVRGLAFEAESNRLWVILRGEPGKPAQLTNFAPPAGANCERACRNFATLLYWRNADAEIATAKPADRAALRTHKLADLVAKLDAGIEFCVSKCEATHNDEQVACTIAATTAARAEECVK